MKSATRFQVLVSVAALAMSGLTGYALSKTTSHTLASPESFYSIGDVAQRSAAMFTELGRVLTHPRCVNCHPAGDRPHQGDESRLHQPPVIRGADGHGSPAMSCLACPPETQFGPRPGPGRPERD